MDEKGEHALSLVANKLGLSDDDVFRKGLQMMLVFAGLEVGECVALVDGEGLCHKIEL